MKTIQPRDMSAIKRNFQNVFPVKERMTRIAVKLQELTKTLNDLEITAKALDAGSVAMTGYTSDYFWKTEIVDKKKVFKLTDNVRFNEETRLYEIIESESEFTEIPVEEVDDTEVAPEKEVSPQEFQPQDFQEFKY